MYAEYKNMIALIPVHNPSPVGFLNVYEDGDEWVKIKSCLDCPIE